MKEAELYEKGGFVGTLGTEKGSIMPGPVCRNIWEFGPEDEHSKGVSGRPKVAVKMKSNKMSQLNVTVKAGTLFQ